MPIYVLHWERRGAVGDGLHGVADARGRDPSLPSGRCAMWATATSYCPSLCRGLTDCEACSPALRLNGSHPNVEAGVRPAQGAARYLPG